ncbi:SAICAR synthase-like protein [Hesseltinella vesiculosa]|uniref:Kinase n=1 Tax=Hesseltinella vesiculosa TaxID=101127 RepID=A0A1X2GX32_9FUNG|nr:SAICAR synthase-like protein [Hesseltinella vesiculosa]
MDLKRFDNQVAGHDNILQFSTHDLLIIKPCSDQEQLFYEQAQAHDDFLDWIPECYGTLRQATDKEIQMLNKDEQATSLPRLDNPSPTADLDHHLCLENIVSGFVQPCIVDIKLGYHIYEDTADEKKKAKMIRNAQGTTTESMGLRISGMKVFQPQEHGYIVYPKQYGRDRTKDNFIQGLLSFFYPGQLTDHRADDTGLPLHCRRVPLKNTSTSTLPLNKKKIEWIVEHFMDTIEEIMDFLMDHPELHLTASSLLLVYEGDADAAQRIWQRYLDEDKQHDSQPTAATLDQDEEQDNEDEVDEPLEPKLCDVRLIDFARSRWEHGRRDEQDPSLMKALGNMLSMLQQVLSDPPV